MTIPVGGRGAGPRASGPGWRRSPFFWTLVALSLVTLAIAAWYWRVGQQTVSGQSRPTASAPAAPAPEFTLPNPEGAKISLRDFRGQVVLLNFWATWCPPCTAEMPDLNAIQRDYGAAKGLVVVGINLEESPEVVTAFADQLRLTFPLLLDRRGDVTKRYAVRTLPASVVVDRDGMVRDRWTGRLSRSAMLARLQQVW